MNDVKMLKLMTGFSIFGIVLLFPILVLFISYNKWDGVFLLTLIICTLTYGYVYRNIAIFKSKNILFIFKNIDVIKMVSVSLLFAVATVLGIIFWPHIIILSAGLSMIAFAISSGFEYIIFDFKSRTIDGLFRDGQKTMNDLTIKISDDNTRIEILSLGTTDSLILKKEIYGNSVWTRLNDVLIKLKNNPRFTRVI